MITIWPKRCEPRPRADRSWYRPRNPGIAFFAPHTETQQVGESSNGRWQRAGDIRDFAEIGTTSIIINLTALDLNAMLDRMEDFATNVVPLTSG